MAYTSRATGTVYSDEDIAKLLADNPQWKTMSADERRATGTYGMMQPDTNLITESSARTGNVRVPSSELLTRRTPTGSSWSPQTSVDEGYMTPEQLAQWRADRGSGIAGPPSNGTLYTGNFEPPEGAAPIEPPIYGPPRPPGMPLPPPIDGSGLPPTPPGYPPLPQPPPAGKGGGAGWNPQGTGSYDAFRNPNRPMAGYGQQPMPPIMQQPPIQPMPQPPMGGKGGQVDTGFPTFNGQPTGGGVQPMPAAAGKGGQQPQPNSQQMLMQALTGMMQNSGTGQQ